MSGKTVNSAILLLVIGNAMAILSDVFIKLLDPGAPVFQFAFLRCVLTLAFLLPLARKLDLVVRIFASPSLAPSVDRSRAGNWTRMTAIHSPNRCVLAFACIARDVERWRAVPCQRACRECIELKALQFEPPLVPCAKRASS